MENIEKIHKITQFMAQIGVSEVETGIYLKLLELGATSVTELAYKMKMARTTVFENTEKLVDKGLITRTVRGKRRLLVAEDPGKVKSIVDAKEVELVSKQKELDGVKGGLDGFVKSVMDMVPEVKERSEVAVRYYEDRKGVKLIYEEALDAKELRAILNTKKVLNVFPENVELFISQHNQREDMVIWEITENSEEIMKNYVQKMAKGRYFHKTIPKDLDVSIIDYMIFDGKVAIINPSGDIGGLVITNDQYYLNAKAMFEFIWNMIPSGAIYS